MTFLSVFVLVAVIVCGVICHDDYCETDAECKTDECCVKSYIPGRRSKVCKDMGDENGERCGGDYQCNTCAKGLRCVPDEKSIWNKLRKGTGSCQRAYNVDYSRGYRNLNN